MRYVAVGTARFFVVVTTFTLASVESASIWRDVDDFLFDTDTYGKMTKMSIVSVAAAQGDLSCRAAPGWRSTAGRPAHANKEFFNVQRRLSSPVALSLQVKAAAQEAPVQREEAEQKRDGDSDTSDNRQASTAFIDSVSKCTTLREVGAIVRTTWSHCIILECAKKAALQSHPRIHVRAMKSS
jgi:hypothetical protein